ncbi:hypothetical protein [Cellulomonas sp. S1-8]|uniref:DUF7144 family membrane protein n=1 Tax=Cellulomonas sp. S1-8 TaxID=2904790 RepID=UPI002243D596|nr:hypothetical protein [Cellulomonas sp. S1-8]UZN03086.1 hypothetical protein OKX07_18860 [Cellulomonas sp. S1-8]
MAARGPSAWVGWAWFGAFALIVVGFTNVIAGAVAAFSSDVVVSWSAEGVAVVDVSTWGWVHLLLGAALALTGFALMNGATWARVTAIVLIGLNVLAQFVSLPATPWWSVVAIALSFAVLWALTVHGDDVENVAG